MINRLLLATLFLSFTIYCAGQGRKINGLKAGAWREKFIDANHNYTMTGNYKIVQLSRYDTIRQLDETSYEIRYKRSSPLLFYEGNVNGQISVKDGIWKSFDPGGKIRQIDYWTEGLNPWTKYFDGKGNLTEYDFDDYENDTSFYLSYINGELFKKAFYPPEDKNHQTEIYYPDSKLIISDAELFLVVNFLTKPSATAELSLDSREDLTVTSISSKRSFITITSSTNQPITFPLKVSPTKPILIRIVASPTAANYQMTDTLLISTNESSGPYHIYSEIFAHHLTDRSAETLTSIELSKTKDKNLILGALDEATIVSKNGEKHHYEINGTTKIDLSSFSPGTYDLFFSSCNGGGQLKLIIKE